jgi:hypothetical protein
LTGGRQLFDSASCERSTGEALTGEKPTKLHKVSEVSTEVDTSTAADSGDHGDHGGGGGGGGGGGVVGGGVVGGGAGGDAAVVLGVLGALGAAWLDLAQHRGDAALAALHALPLRHLETAEAQHLVGRAHFEKAEYGPARDALELMSRLQPHRMRGLELLSTALWQLGKKVRLGTMDGRWW